MHGRRVALCVAYAATGKTQKYSVSKRHTDARHDTCPVLETSRLSTTITHAHAADGGRALCTDRRETPNNVDSRELCDSRAGAAAAELEVRRWPLASTSARSRRSVSIAAHLSTRAARRWCGERRRQSAASAHKADGARVVQMRARALQAGAGIVRGAAWAHLGPAVRLWNGPSPAPPATRCRAPSAAV